MGILIIDGIRYEISAGGRVYCDGEEVRQFLNGKFLSVRVGRGRRIYVHRLVWEAFRGEVEASRWVAHVSEDLRDNRLANLRLLSRSVDAGGRVIRRNYRRGVECGLSKLNDNAVRLVRELCESGMTQGRVAAAFGVSQGAISNIVRRETWKS